MKKSKKLLDKCANCGYVSRNNREHEFSSVNPLCEECYEVVCEMWADVMDDYKNYKLRNK